MTNASPCVIDTSAFYALAIAEDLSHEAALQTYRQLIDTEQSLWTTSYVLVETHALLQRRYGFAVSLALSDAIVGVVQILWVDQSLHNEAWSRLVARNGGGLSLVDWTVAISAASLGAIVFAFDRDFRHEGITVIP